MSKETNNNQNDVSSTSSSNDSASEENTLKKTLYPSKMYKEAASLPIIDSLLKTTDSNKKLFTNDDHVIILTSGSLTSFNDQDDDEKSTRLNSIAHYLCCFCRCCKITNTMFWSWLSIFCCCCPLLGGISLYCTYKSNKYKLKQKYDLADRYSSYAEKLNIASLIFGVLFYAVIFFMLTLVLFMYWRHSYA